jgi:hypothetical protein
MNAIFVLLFFELVAGSKKSNNELMTHYPAIPLNCHHPSRITFGIGGGGFGDRLRGLVTIFYQALLTNASFSIDWRSPFDLSRYFHLSNCPIPSGRQSFPIVKRRIIDHWNYFLNEKYLDHIGEKNLRIETNSYHWTLLVRNPIFLDYVHSLDLHSRTKEQLFQIAFDSIFLSPTLHLQKAFDEFLHRMGTESYLGVQLRFGGDLVKWIDPPRQSLDSIDCYVHEVIRLCSQTNLKAIFLTGDSVQANQKFKDSFANAWKVSHHGQGQGSHDGIPVIYENIGEIAHIDRTPHVSSEAVWLKSILDWWLLRHARVLVISRSGFGETAAWASKSLLARKGNHPFARTLMDNCTFVNTFSLRLEETVDRMFIHR